ncbi:hypothetical protein COF80_32580 [Bacillus toyonensis]|uniref:hypothetical protein n=1 Tax=Bacillus toyonensis TaxID=155322 RepID=UPI000BFE33DD|nr:hypothetical protein [Bacillus toyonensis]PHE78033.1 hypothetical protein COF80_32580 [Bacillus toyonensis]
MNDKPIDELSVMEEVKIKNLCDVQLQGIYEIPDESDRVYSIAFVTESEDDEKIKYVTEISQGKGSLWHYQYEINHIPENWKLLNEGRLNFLNGFHKELRAKILASIQKNKRIVILPGQTRGKTYLTRKLRDHGYDAIELWEAFEGQIELTSQDIFLDLDEFVDVKEGQA